MKRIGYWLAIGLLIGAPAQAASAPAPAACDRECLRSQMTQLLWSLVKHDSTRVPVASTVRITEDAVEKPLKDVALFRSVTALRGFRQDFIDERTGVVGAHVMVEESGAPVMLVVRLKVVAYQLTEIELVPTRSRTDGLIFNIDGLKAASAMIAKIPLPLSRYIARHFREAL